MLTFAKFSTKHSTIEAGMSLFLTLGQLKHCSRLVDQQRYYNSFRMVGRLSITFHNQTFNLHRALMSTMLTKIDSIHPLRVIYTTRQKF